MMTLLPVVTATLADDHKAFTLHARTGTVAWTGTYDIRTLDGWIRFYRDLRDRRAGQFRPYYDKTVTALERVRAEAGV